MLRVMSDSLPLSHLRSNLRSSTWTSWSVVKATLSSVRKCWLFCCQESRDRTHSPPLPQLPSQRPPLPPLLQLQPHLQLPLLPRRPLQLQLKPQRLQPRNFLSNNSLEDLSNRIWTVKRYGIAVLTTRFTMCVQPESAEDGVEKKKQTDKIDFTTDDNNVSQEADAKPEKGSDKKVWLEYRTTDNDWLRRTQRQQMWRRKPRLLLQLQLRQSLKKLQKNLPKSQKLLPPKLQPQNRPQRAASYLSRYDRKMRRSRKRKKIKSRMTRSRHTWRNLKRSTKRKKS